VRERAFREFLANRGIDSSTADKQVAYIQQVEKYLHKGAPHWTLGDLNQSSTQAVVDGMIDRGENTIENLQALLRYAKVIENQTLFVTIFQMLDGYEAMEGLHQKLGEVVGEDLRDVVFEDMPLPPLGLSRREKARYTYRIMKRLLEIFEESTCREIFKDSLRYLPDNYFTEAKEDYWEKCDGDIDRYLTMKSQKFMDLLQYYHKQNELFFGQEITNEVLAFVDAHQEMGGGVRQGNIIFETKIPYNTKEYLKETDPGMKRYLYCHCPWVKESLKGGVLKVSPLFCQCSAGFHKKPYEVIFGESIKAEVLANVLNGDLFCRFAIHLPDGIC